MTERERLIELIDTALDKHTSTIENYVIPLKEYLADYLLENGVIVPPCKVGDVVYWYSMVGKLIEAQVVKNGYAAKTALGAEYPVYYDVIGKVVFPTREEAEQARKGE